jgi:RNA polymerase sigma-70 factor (ECF subfamily)
LRNLEDSESWRVFFERYWRLIYNVARKSGLSDDQAQDVVQETVIAVARKMPEFRYDPAKGSFKNWLLLICRRRIHDHLRRIYSSRQLATQSSEELPGATENLPAAMLPPDAQLEGDWEQEWRENVFQMALVRVRQQSNPKHYQVFDCCVLQGMSASQAAAMLGLSAAQVYLAKHRVSSAIKRAAKEIEVELGTGRPVAGGTETG